MGEVIQLHRQQLENGYQLQLAAGAEFIVGQACYISLCPEVTTDAREFVPSVIAFNADQMPHLREVRREARHYGVSVHAARKQQLLDGEFGEVVLDVDAIGTADKIAYVASMYGLGSPEHMEARQGLLVDCSRKIGEASRKNSWEYFSHTTQTYDAETDQLYAHGMSVDEMLLNGISPLAEAEEVLLRINDIVTHVTTKEILKSHESGPVATLRFSPCPEWAHQSLRNNPKSAHGGYAPEIDKLMVNFDTFDMVTREVHHEQLAVSGLYITPQIMQSVLQKMNIITTESPMSRSEIHGTVGVVPGNHMSSVLDVMQLLDREASETSGKNIFLGEVVTENHPKDYFLVMKESEARRVEQQALSEQLAAYVEQLHADNIDHAIATQMVEKFIQDKLLDIAETNPEKAAIIFNQQTAQRFERAAKLAGHGFMNEAAQLRSEARREAPPSSSCGAGSCGLESINMLSGEGISIKKKLQATDGDTIVKDTVRSCKNCGEKAVVYAYTNNKVNKACTNCSAFEQKRTK